MRIAVGGLHTESATSNPVPTAASDFRQLRGAALLADPTFAFLAEYDATFVPVLHARALPGGPVTPEAYSAFRAELVAGISAALPLDAVYLAMHGAMFVTGLQDAEGDFIAALRDLVGPDCLIAASYDLHGNLSPRIVAALDIFASYRTAPHIDVEATMRRAVAMLCCALTSGTRPTVRWCPVPVLLPGERTSTEDEPARSFYAALPGHEGGAVWDASFQVGYVWADEPRATAAAVVTGTDPAAQQRLADSLAQGWWDARASFAFGMIALPPAEALALALAGSERPGAGPVILADSGDNPTGGGVGDRADLLAALIAAGARDAILAGIADAPATAAAFAAGSGGRLTLAIGGTLDRSSLPVTLSAMVLHLADDAQGRMAVLRTGGIRLVVTTRRRPFHHLADFAALGLDLQTAALVVVKSGYLSPELAPLANPGILALTDGAVPQDASRLTDRHRRHPTYPFATDFDWQSATVAE
jgi:microcystin degradation protein MlrC